MWWRTNWCEKARLTPEMPNSNQICCSGEACPVASRVSMNSCICSREMRPSAMRASICAGVSAE